MSSDADGDDDAEEVMELARPSSFRDGCCSSWVVMGAAVGEPAGDGTNDGGDDDPGDVSWNRLTAAAVDGLLLLLLLLLLLVDSDDNKQDDDADVDGDDDDDDD